MSVTANHETSYQYPRSIRRLITVTWMALLIFNLVEYVLEWVRAIYALLYAPLHLPFIAILEPYQNILINLLIAHLGLFVALYTARILALLTPQIRFEANGLKLTTPLTTHQVAYASLRSVRSTELANGRYVVWLGTTQGLPWHDALASLIFARRLWRGMLITSDLAGFDDVLATVVARLKQKYGAEKFAAHFIEDKPTWLLAMLNAPRATIQAVVAAETLPISQRESIQQIISVALAPILPIVVGALIHLQFPIGAILIPLIAALEFPLVAMYLTAVPITDLRHISFSDALRVYPLTQLPRWVFAIALTLGVIAGMPLFCLVLVIGSAAILGNYLALQLIEAWFEVKFPSSLLGIIVSGIYQFILYELLVALIPR